ncbi:hypothetical protein QAD02_004437 [Eretmocerus hayati]|uniref:Uncharacterized protein n=1 Tax=Eretmocerus hayati TaxID=131215 RepID=A0ACC2NPQ6_9HYME|nr:hypothetical protein QAD02_004437 [Eretmocerus hayati]
MMLDISNNPLTALGYFLEKFPTTVKNLTMENVGLNFLSTESLKNLTTLNFNSNNFEILCSSFCYGNVLFLKNVDELETLLVANNSIRTIETDAFKDLQKLIHLDISNNSLREIPHGVFEHLHSLSYLDISENYLGKIPNISTLSNLDTLKLDNMKNGLVLADPRDMPAMPRIRLMSLRGNSIKHVPENFLSKFQGIEEIDLSNNKLIALNPGLWPKNLKKINLSHNQIAKIEDLQLDHATSLEVLDLENNNIRGMNVSAVQLLPRSVFLKM